MLVVKDIKSEGQSRVWHSISWQIAARLIGCPTSIVIIVIIVSFGALSSVVLVFCIVLALVEHLSWQSQQAVMKVDKRESQSGKLQ